MQGRSQDSSLGNRTDSNATTCEERKFRKKAWFEKPLLIYYIYDTCDIVMELYNGRMMFPSST